MPRSRIAANGERDGRVSTAPANEEMQLTERGRLVGAPAADDRCRPAIFIESRSAADLRCSTSLRDGARPALVDSASWSRRPSSSDARPGGTPPGPRPSRSTIVLSPFARLGARQSAGTAGMFPRSLVPWGALGCTRRGRTRSAGRRWGRPLRRHGRYSLVTQRSELTTAGCGCGKMYDRRLSV
jgi:hypothetical protein